MHQGVPSRLFYSFLRIEAEGRLQICSRVDFHLGHLWTGFSECINPRGDNSPPGDFALGRGHGQYFIFCP